MTDEDDDRPPETPVAADELDPGPQPLDGETARDFTKRVWEVTAINTLGKFLSLRGRQSMVALGAARALLEFSNMLSEGRVDKLVDEKFQKLVEEARRQIEARNAGAVLESKK